MEVEFQLTVNPSSYDSVSSLPNCPNILFEGVDACFSTLTGLGQVMLEDF